MKGEIFMIFVQYVLYDDGSLYYLESITFKKDDKANIYGYAYDYETYCEELNGETANDPENELMKIVRFDN